jgi:hypothetical protein
MRASKTCLSCRKYLSTTGRFKANRIALTVKFAFTAACSQGVPFSIMSSKAVFNRPETPFGAVFPIAARCWVVSS